LNFTKEIDKCTNNIAEYEAISLGPHKLQAMRVQNYILRIDSKVIAGQIEKECIEGLYAGKTSSAHLKDVELFQKVHG
jgi:ribonuclease HI